MTEKRFYYAHGIIIDTHKDNHINKIGTIKDLDIGLRIVNWLNELNDENKQLKNMVRHSYVEHKRCVNNYVDKIKEVEKENEQLKSKNRGLQSELQIFKEDVTHSNLQINKLAEENEQLKAQLYCNDEEGVCNICKHHYLVKDDEAEFGYYTSRCKKGHYECARVSLKYCDDFELDGDVE